MVSQSRALHFLLLLKLLCFIFLILTSAHYAQGANSSIIHGSVIDASTGQPINNATVAVWDGVMLKAMTNTDTNGHYKVSLRGGFQCRIYAYHDAPKTPGFDYLPALQSFYLQEGTEVDVQFALLPSASIILEGDILFVDSLQPLQSVVFTIIDPKTGSMPTVEGHIFIYGAELSHSRFLNLDPRHVVVPANVPVNVKVDASIYDRGWRNNTFLIDIEIRLSQGEKIKVDVQRYSLQYNLQFVEGFLELVEKRVVEAERTGFYIVAEKEDLARVRGLISTAGKKLADENYRECYADLKESYIIVRNVDEAITTMYAEASTSVNALIFFLTFTALASAYLISERGVTKALAASLFYILSLTALYLVYPGCRLINATLFFNMVVTSLAVFLFALFFIPRIFKEKRTVGWIALRSAVFATFSMAKRNLKRRRFRSALTMISIVVLAMSFVAFTSFSLGYGFTITSVFRPLWRAVPPSDGLLIRQPFTPTPMAEFLPMSPTAIDWLQKETEVRLVSPKAENLPRITALGSLNSLKTSTAIQIFGIIGISPEAEEKITHLNALVVQGRYLLDNDVNAALITQKAAEMLNIKVGEKLLLKDTQIAVELEIVGLIDDGLISQLVDIDDSSFMPRKIVIPAEGQARLDFCETFETIVTTWTTALRFPGVFLSRVAAQVKEAKTILPLARRIVLEREYWVWGALGGQVYFARLESYIEARGLTILIPWIMVIFNVVITVINSIYERRNEVFVLSATGLNPSHLTALFAVEALILGVIGGGIGYILGLTSYQIMILFVGMDVRQKVSAAWCFAALVMAVASVLAGSMFAIKTSVIATPSLLRKWRIEREPSSSVEPWVVPIPIKVPEDRIDSFLSYVEDFLRRYERGIELCIERVKRVDRETPEAIMKGIKFTYRGGFGTSPSSSLTINECRLTKKRGETIYTAELISRGPRNEDIYETANLIRKLVLQYSTQENHQKLGTVFRSENAF